MMAERLSMMPGYCTEHDLRFDRLGCPICVIDKFDAPINPEQRQAEEAVLRAAEAYMRAHEDKNAPVLYQRGALFEAVRRLRDLNSAEQD